MAGLFKRKSTECNLIGREGEVNKYVCRTPAGKEFLVEVDQATENMKIKKAVVNATPAEYREIMKTLKEKHGEKVVL